MNGIINVEGKFSEFEQILHDTGHLWYIDIFVSDTMALPIETVVKQFKELLQGWRVPFFGVNITQYITNKRKPEVEQNVVIIIEQADKYPLYADPDDNFTSVNHDEQIDQVAKKGRYNEAGKRVSHKGF